MANSSAACTSARASSAQRCSASAVASWEDVVEMTGARKPWGNHGEMLENHGENWSFQQQTPLRSIESLLNLKPYFKQYPLVN